MKWFSPAQDEINGFLACEACYEDVILAMPWGLRFLHNPGAQQPGQRVGCCIPSDAFGRMVRECGRRGDWNGFVRRANAKLMKNQAPCNNRAKFKTIRDCRWWTVKGSSGDLKFCDTCYTDKWEGSKYEGAFEPILEPRDDFVYGYSPQTCEMKGNTALYMIIAGVTGQKLGVEALRAGLALAASKPRCKTQNGIEDGLFYNFPNELPSFGICEECHAGILKTVGMDKFFSNTPKLLPGRRVCIFSHEHPRFQQLCDIFEEAWDFGAFNIYEQAVRKWIPIPVCVKQDGVKGRRWWGWNDCSICHDCFDTMAVGTKLVPKMQLRGEVVGNEVTCDMWSPRQRARYAKACETGNVEELLAATRERFQVWVEAGSRAQLLRWQVQMEGDNAMLQDNRAHNYRMSNAIDFGTSDTVYTSSSMGNTYQSYNGILAEQEQAVGDAAWKRAMAGNRQAEIAVLSERWSQCE